MPSRPISVTYSPFFFFKVTLPLPRLRTGRSCSRSVSVPQPTKQTPKKRQRLFVESSSASPSPHLFIYSQSVLNSDTARRPNSYQQRGCASHHLSYSPFFDLIYTALGHYVTEFFRNIRSSMHEKQVHRHPRRCPDLAAHLTRRPRTLARCARSCRLCKFRDLSEKRVELSSALEES